MQAPEGSVAPGRSSFDLPLGPATIRVLDLPTTWSPFVAENYAPFARPAAGADPDLVVRCREGSGVVVPLPPPGGSTMIKVDPAEHARYRISSHWQDGQVDLARREGEIVLTDRSHVRFRMSLENYLRVACQLLLLERSAFLMHSSGILDDDRCFLFFGPSGAGKSTSTEYSAPRPALSDDMVLIDVSEHPVAHAVPFYGAYAPQQRAAGRWPIAGAFRLRQSPDDRLERLGAARAVATVSASIPFVHELGLPHEGLTRLVGRLCEKVPVFDLHFTRSGRFWDIIRAEGL